MIKSITLFFSASLLALAAPASFPAAQEGAASGLVEPYWQQQADYTIECRLDPASHTLTGRETIAYTNSSPDTITEFYLHLYPNAYSEKDSPIFRDFHEGTWFFFVGLPGSKRGGMDIKHLRVNDAEAEFSVDGTILTCVLQAPLFPGGKLAIEAEFENRIRSSIGRSGYAGDHYDVAQWYPKMAVYDKNGWHPDQFRKGEFYGEFGTFDVRITLPEDFVVASTGVPVYGDPGWERNAPGAAPAARREGAYGRERTVGFRAENVHDFAWSADPEFAVEDTVFNGYRVMSFYRLWNQGWADSALARGIRALKWMEDFAGPYGYPQVSIVDAPIEGGMEYPMLMMLSAPSEDLISHETGHLWFQGMLANDERAEAWLDEGLAEYQAILHEEAEHGPWGKGGKPGFPKSLVAGGRIWEEIARPVISYHRDDFAERLSQPHHEFESCDHAMIYSKGALFFRALRYHVGDESFRKIMHAYFDRWKFRHVDEEVLFSISEEISGADLGDFFSEWLHSTKDCDYRIDRFKVVKSETGYTADVAVKRTGESIMPLTLAFRMKDGNTETRRIEGIWRDHSATFDFAEKPVSLALNPENEILDVRLMDNFAPRRRDFDIDVPFSGRYPADAYQFRILPIGYYNDIDGGKAGIRIRGSYDNAFGKFTLQGLYGFESEKADVYGAYERAVGYFGRESILHLEGYAREGRQGGTIDIEKTRRKSLSQPFFKIYTLGATYQELTDTAYVFPGTYEEGLNIKTFFRIESSPRTDLFTSSLSLGLERSVWGSDFNYEKLVFASSFAPSFGWPLPVGPRLRFFFGHASIDPPPQEQFHLAGAGVLEKEDFFWLRSKGAFWKDRYNNFRVPGGGNMRGYFDADFSFKRIFSSNIELHIPLPARGRVLKILDPSLFLFYDWGKVLETGAIDKLPAPLAASLDRKIFSDVLQDFGIGINLWKLAAEFPIYLSHPELAGSGENWEMRWTVGFRSGF